MTAEELVADQPEAVGSLQVVAGGRLPVARQAGRDELRAERAEGGPIAARTAPV